MNPHMLPLKRALVGTYGQQRQPVSRRRIAEGGVTGPEGGNETPPSKLGGQQQKTSQSEQTIRRGPRSIKNYQTQRDESTNHFVLRLVEDQANLHKNITTGPKRSLPAVVAVLLGANNLPALDQSFEMPPHHERNPEQYQAAFTGGIGRSRRPVTKTEVRAV